MILNFFKTLKFLYPIATKLEKNRKNKVKKLKQKI